MKQKILLLLFIFLSILMQAQSPDANGVFYVKKNAAGGTGSGNSWANSIPELATALKQARDLNAATPGRVKQIWAAGGTYLPLYRNDIMTGPTTTDRDNSFVLLSNVKVYGGFAGTETALTARNLSIAANKSILSGNLGNTSIATDNAYHVVASSGNVGTAELNGFSIVEGYANGNNYTYVNGGTIGLYQNYGGCAFIYSSSPILANLDVRNNFANQVGGIHFNESSSILNNIALIGNQSNDLGSALNFHNSQITITNATISGNSGGSGVLYIGTSSSVTLYNSVVSGSSNGVSFGGGVLNRRNSLVQDFPADAANFNLDGSLDPKFINAPNFATAPFATGNYNLQSDSPLINKGNNAYLQASQTTDIAGRPRTIDGIVDIGAYESSSIPLTVTASKTDVACFGGADGTATATVVTGIAPYTYSWNTTPVQNTATATHLTAGTYTVTVTDATNAQATSTVTLTEPAAIIVTVTGNETCEGSTATVTASGADTYNWYATASGGSPITTGAVFTTPSLSTPTTYYVEGEKNATVLSQPASLETTFIGGNGQNGNMFNVSATTDLIISGFDINPQFGNHTIQVYYKTGGYQGFELTPSAWTLLGSTTITITTAGAISISVGNLSLQSGQTYGLYITSTAGSLSYTDGSTDYTDGTLTITSGTGNAYPFSTVYTPRVWNGRIHYKKMPVCTSPRIPVTIAVNPPAVLAIAGANVTCNGAHNGEATVTATGAGPFIYSWNTVPVQNTATATDLAPGNYTVTVTDANGCEALESTAITEPAVLAASISSFTNATCTAAADGEATAAVTGGTAPYTYSWDTVPVQNTATATGLIPGSYTVTVTDANGCIAANSITINIEDTVFPIAIAQSATIQLDASGNATVTASDIDDGSSDNCGIDTIVLDITNFDCSNLGGNAVTLTVTDNNGNTSTATAIVTVEDTVNPTVITQDITVYLDATGTATITASQIDNGSSDNCGIAILALDAVSFDCSNLGPNTVTLTATDSSGNSSTGTAIVTVADAVNPLVITQDITVYLDASGTATITASDIDNGSSDDCAIDTLALDAVSFDCSNLGPNTVTLTATDSSGNNSSGTAVVTVVNTMAPAIVTQDITVQLNSSGMATIVSNDIVISAGSNCGIDTIVLDITNFDCSDLGDNTVTVTATDNNGTTSTATAIVTVVDSLNPIVVTQDITVYLNASGAATITASQIDNGSSDNCAIDTLALDAVSFDCSNLGPNTVTLTATDSSGNSSTGTAIVTVADTINPIVVTQDITVYLDASGTATITASQIDNGSSDNCAIDTLALDAVSFDCTNLGPNTVTLTATDSSGNTSSGTAVVTVVNTMAPAIVTQDITVQLNAGGTATIVSNDIVISAGSNCGVASVVLDVTDFDCTTIGANTVTVTATDNNGTTSTATAIVTVVDALNPIVVTQDITVYLDASGTATITASDIDNGSSDNCGITTLALNLFSFDCSNLGPNTVTLTATDSSGNSMTGTAIVTVADSLGPVITAQSAILNLDADGAATLTVPDVVVNVTDNCGVASTQISETDFDCSTLGNNTVVITSIDINGNTSQQSVSVSVQDNIPPVAIAQDIQVSLTENGTFTLTPSMIDNGSSDNCSIASISADITNFSCNQIGENTVILTVTDTFGNINTATAIVTVLPIPEPTVSHLTQEFCAIDEPIVSDIAIGDTLVQWFANATGGNPLSNAAALNSGTYYVAAKYGNCYSSRVAVTIIVKDPPAPTGAALQYICREQPYTIASLATNEEEILWYDSPSGGTPLSGSIVLEHQQKYYASQIIGDCESIKRLEVEVEVRYCDVVIYNSVSANGDGKNDYFKIEGISYFPDNTVEIFNQWGQIVYKTSRYGEASGNYFKGIANSGIGISGAGQTLLPFGTYYYVIQFLNHDKQRVQKTGYLHLNH